MSGKSYAGYSDVRAVCPFYKGLDVRAVRCEGVQRGSTILLCFASTRRTREYFGVYCASLDGCMRCSINRMMTIVYQDGA